MKLSGKKKMKFHALAGLFYENGQFSISKIAFWIVFGISIHFWLFRPEMVFPASLLEALLIAMTAIFVGKGIDTYKDVRLQEILKKQRTVFGDSGEKLRDDVDECEK